MVTPGGPMRFGQIRNAARSGTRPHDETGRSDETQ